MIFNEQPEGFKPDIEVVGCLVEHDGKILLLHRHDHKSQGGKWGLPAGKIDKTDRDKVDALIREIQEETGLVLEKDKLIYHKTFFVHYPEKKYLYHYFETNIESIFDVCIKEDEHQDFCWVTPEEALNMSLVMDEEHCLKYVYGIK